MGSSGALTRRHVAGVHSACGHGDTQESHQAPKKCWIKSFPALHSTVDFPTHSSGFAVIVCPQGCILPPFCSSSMGQSSPPCREGWLTPPLGRNRGAKLLWSSREQGKQHWFPTSPYQMLFVRRTSNNTNLVLSRGNPFRITGDMVMAETDLKYKIFSWNSPQFILDN